MLKMLFEIRDVLKSFDLDKGHVFVEKDLKNYCSKNKVTLLYCWSKIDVFVTIYDNTVRFSVSDINFKRASFELPIKKFRKDLFYKLVENTIENYKLINR